MQWANGGRHGVNSVEYFLITKYLWDLEGYLEEQSQVGIWTKPVLIAPRKIHVLRDSIHWSRRFEYPWVFWEMELTEKEIILDAGGGQSSFQFLLAKNAREVHNVDSNEERLRVVEIVKKKIENCSNLKCLHGSLLNLPYKDNFFDRTCCISVLEHLNKEDVVSAINELRRVTKRGEKVLISLDICLEEHPFRMGIKELEMLSKTFNFLIPKPENLLIDFSGDPKIGIEDYRIIATACIVLGGI